MSRTDRARAACASGVGRRRRTCPRGKAWPQDHQEASLRWVCRCRLSGWRWPGKEYVRQWSIKLATMNNRGECCRAKAVPLGSRKAGYDGFTFHRPLERVHILPRSAAVVRVSPITVGTLGFGLDGDACHATHLWPPAEFVLYLSSYRQYVVYKHWFSMRHIQYME